MVIRKATQTDYIKIVRSIQNKKIEYLTPHHVKEDLINSRIFVAEENNKIIAIVSIVYDSQFNYHAIKRLCIPNNKNKGRGLAYKMIDFAARSVHGKVGCTPWIDNKAMQHILKKMGFKLEYVFNEKWCFYSIN